ncbi:expressed unknown protein [Seminavis robusta]|uniref:Uncharacterized protein n=1 Tax=Seminavis robusta TaxID=568900 RepID=A0A9N8DNX4_9STRA|nr:expressed unknown protein [Seminavis robusta]|eukprot:Sro160_g072060.1 n/a (466) ;mRNA; r:22827-24224
MTRQWHPHPTANGRWTRRFYILCLLSLSGCLSGVTVAKKSTSTTAATIESPYAQDLNDWVRARCNNDNDNDIALWVYQGALVDPLEGRKIANVQGLEIVRCIANVGTTTSPQDSKRLYQQQCGDLQVAKLIGQANATFDRVSTILSRKLFCYQPPDGPPQLQQQQPNTNNTNQELLRQIKLRPNAPKRYIPIQQSIAVYDTATTFIARGAQLIAHTEWPDRQSIWGMVTRTATTTTTPTTNADDQTTTKSFEFTIFARLKSLKTKPEELFDLTTTVPPTDDSNNSQVDAAVSSPKRSKLIEFGTGSSRSKDKFGARETYSYTNIPASGSLAPPTRRGWWGRPKTATTTTPPQVRYSRYGEGPPFVGPGRTCTLELQGKRVSSVDDLPPFLANVVAERLSPRFLTSVMNTSSSSSELPQWFRQSERLLQIQPDDDNEKARLLPEQWRDRGQKAWHQVRQRVSTLFG